MPKKTYKSIAVVDVNKVVIQSKQVQELKAEQEARVRELNQWLANVKADVESRATNEEKQALVAEYNKQFAQRQNEIKVKYTEKLQAIEKNISELIAKSAEEKGYDIVLSKYITLYGGDDITEEIMEIVE